jgi:DNA-binding CsgD family transcriptional regulator/PAS domain-containing protein
LLDEDLELIELAYAATTREATLMDSVKRFLELQGDPGGAMFHYDSITGQVSDTEVVALDAGQAIAIQEVFDSYSSDAGQIENPLITAGLADLLDGKVLINDDVLPFEELKRTEYYRSVLEPLGVRWTMGWIAAGKGQRWMTFTSSRARETGEYTRENVKRAELYQRHMARVIHVLELLDHAQDTKQIFEESADKLPQAIVLIDDARRITFCNAAARTLLLNSKALNDRDGVFSVGRTTHEQGKFESWWNLLVSAVAVDGAQFDDADMAPVWQIDVSRLGSTAAKRGTGRRWMVTLKQRPDAGDTPLAYLQSQFELTPAEAQVCASLCKNGDAVSTAAILNLSPNTVRSHLKSAFRKTGTKNQVELAIKLVSGV